MNRPPGEPPPITRSRLTDQIESDDRSVRATERARAEALLEHQDGLSMRGSQLVARTLDRIGIDGLLRASRRIAVVGASSNPIRPSHGVMRYLLEQGFDCVPVNPNEVEVLGRKAYPDLRSAVEAGGPFDIVDVFRRSEAVPPHAREAVETRARALWLQLGVISLEAIEVASAGGLAVVMDRCIAVEHRRLRRAG